MEIFLYVGIFGFFFGIALFTVVCKIGEIVYENHSFRKENEFLEKKNLQLTRKNKALRELLNK